MSKPRIDASASSHGTEFVRDRIGLSASVGSIGAGIGLIIHSGSLLITGAGIMKLGLLAHLGGVACLALLWSICQRSKLPLQLLLTAELVLLTLASACFLVMSQDIGRSIGSDKLVLVILGLTVVLRAALIPSRASFLVLLGTLLGIPLLIVTYNGLADVEPADAFVQTMWTLVPWCCIVGASAAISQHVYGLHRRLLEAQKLGQYLLEGEINRGAMGIVYRGRHALLQKPIAIKMIKDRDPRLVKLFQREVSLTCKLTHLNTISVYDFGLNSQGEFYFVMELLNGRSLQDIVQITGPLPASRTIAIAKQICGALAEAHDLQLVHRDIKADNVMLCILGGQHDVAKVLDFGLVKSIAPDGTHTFSGVAVGTPEYMAPEAFQTPDLVTDRTDVYALGVLLFFLTTGDLLFSGTISEILDRHATESPRKPSDVAIEELPSGLDEIILDCLAKTPKDRPSIREVRARLDSIDAGGWSEERAAAWWTANEAALTLQEKQLPGSTRMVLSTTFTDGHASL